jgi:hypothetical protein
MRRRSARERHRWAARPSGVLQWSAVLGASLVVGQVAGGQARALAVAAEGSGGQAVPGAAGGPDHSVDDPLDDPLIVEIWTFGPGDHPFTRFGHDAIRIADRSTGLDVSYNFGTFAFGSAHLLGDFLQGRLRYWLSAASTRAMASLYRRENRTIEIQRLALTPAQKRTLAEHLVVNAEPAHRDYRYDYFADNCSTRVRDALDAEGVLGGALRASAHGPGQETLRGHALRMTAEEPWLYLALLVVLGPSTDRPIDVWAEAFLPERLQRMLRAVSVGGGPGASHGHPLVQAELVSFRAARAPVPEHPPGWGGRFFAVGAVLGGGLWRLGMVGARSRARSRPGQRRSVTDAVAVVPLARIAYGVLCAFLGLLVGFVGSFLVGAWMFTPHAVVYRNQNALLFAPFALALVVLGIGVGFGRTGAARKAFFVAAAGTALGLGALGLKLLPAGVVAHQDNGALIAAMLALWAGLAAGARALARPSGREADRPVTARGGSST